MNNIFHGLGVAFFVGVFGWVIYLVSRLRRLDKLERDLHVHEVTKEYDKKVREFLDHDLNTRVKLSNERLGLGDTKPKGDE